MADLQDTITIASMGMKAQGQRLRVITENLANADSAPLTAGGDPYTRKVISFQNILDSKSGLNLVEVASIKPDTTSPFEAKFNPGHPGADENGYVRMPNVTSLIEIMDAKEAQRSYEANLGMIDQAKTMISQTIDLLR